MEVINQVSLKKMGEMLFKQEPPANHNDSVEE